MKYFEDMDDPHKLGHVLVFALMWLILCVTVYNCIDDYLLHKYPQQKITVENK